MNKLFTLILSVIAVSLFAQESQKGLLWKISGNGLEKPSYIYGNMHVSSKVAFHLGVEFFDAIESVDEVALESNPIIWLDRIMNSDLAYNYIGRFSFTRSIDYGFYKKAFKVSVPDNDDYAQALKDDHYFMNWLLYREDKSETDFEEETFLDMFIYQAGAKNGKPVISLEDFEKTTRYFELSSIPDKDEKEPSQWFKKLVREKGYSQVMEDAYRKQDLSLIDSIQHETSGYNSLYWMIYKRNENMANAIDSVLKSGKSLFSGVGAAHLPGKKGILKLLEKKGYTLTPMPVTFNDKARTLREEFDKKKRPLTDYKTYSWDMFSVQTPVKMYETPYSKAQRHFFAPELTNGSHYSVKQISTFGIFKGITPRNYYEKIDSLLFENIPGKIESKETFSGEFYKGFDVLNKTKSGDYQRYRIYVTPMEIIIFKMGGKDNFVKDHGKRFFSSIKLKNPSIQWKRVSDIHKDFSVEVPDYYSINYNQKVTALYGQPLLEAWDASDSSYYFLKRSSLYDFDFIEKDKFEAKRIAEQFFLKLKLDTVKAHFQKNRRYPTAFAQGLTKDGKPLTVKVIIHGPYFYLLAAVSKNEKHSKRFFDSFKFDDFVYKFDFKEKADSANFFTVKSNYLVPRDIDYMRNKAYKEKREKNKKKDNGYERQRNSSTYYGENFEEIKVATVKFHIYKSYENIDSLWSDELRKIASHKKSSSYSSYFSETLFQPSYLDFIVKEKKKAVENGLNVLYLTLGDTASSRAIKAKFILKRGMLYKIMAMTDTTGHLSAFAQNFFDGLKPMDTLLGRSLFEDKASLFFKSIYGDDSLARVHAFKSVDMVHFKRKDVDSLMLTIGSYKFPPEYIDVKKSLITDLVTMKDYDAIDFATKLYKSSGDTAMYQMAILNSLASKGTKKSVNVYLDLLDYDIPISGSKEKDGYIFYPLRISVKNHKAKTEVFPDLLNYTFINKYRSEIIGVLARQLDSNFINPKVYKKRVNQILREAKIVLKEQISYEQNHQTDNNSDGYYSYRSNYKYSDNDLLTDYATVLIPYYNKDKNVASFIDKFYALKNYVIRDEVFSRMQKNGIEIDTAVWGELARDPVNISALYLLMKDWHILDKFPKYCVNQRLMAQSLLFQDDLDYEKDSVVFVDKRFVSDGKDSGWVYFFKTKEEGDDDWSLNYCGYQPRDTTKVSLNEDVEETDEYIDKSKDIKEVVDEKVEEIRLRLHPHADGSESASRYGYFF